MTAVFLPRCALPPILRNNFAHVIPDEKMGENIDAPLNDTIELSDSESDSDTYSNKKKFWLRMTLHCTSALILIVQLCMTPLLKVSLLILVLIHYPFPRAHHKENATTRELILGDRTLPLYIHHRLRWLCL